MKIRIIFTYDTSMISSSLIFGAIMAKKWTVIILRREQNDVKWCMKCIPHCFDPLIGAKPKHPRVGALSQTAPHPVDEIAPPSQIPGLNLTQFNNIGTFRPNVAQHIPKPSTRACRARNLFN